MQKQRIVLDLRMEYDLSEKFLQIVSRGVHSGSHKQISMCERDRKGRRI